MPKRTRKAVGIAHNPQVGTIVVLDDGSAVRLVTDDQHKAKGWEELPPFDQTPDDDDEPPAE